MPPRATGELLWSGEYYETRIRLEKSWRVVCSMPWARHQTRDHGRALERSAALAELAKRLRLASRLDLAERLLKLASAAMPGEPWLTARSSVELVCAGGVQEKNDADKPTFAEVVRQWTSGELAQKYPDREKVIDQSANTARLDKWILPRLGPLPVDLIRLEHIEEVMSHLPARLSVASRRHVAQLMVRVMKLAAYPLKLIPVSPIPAGFLPKKPKPKAFGFLYPEEEAQFHRNTKVKLVARLLVGVLAREGMRREEACAMTWATLDRGMIVLDRNKTKDPRQWAAGVDVVAALTLFKQTRPQAEPDDLIFVDDKGKKLDKKHLARNLRLGLQGAGVSRSKLFEQSEARNRLRGHDLRATFVTLALATGRTEAWVTDRTGHRSSGQLYQYKRAARAAEEVGLTWLEPLNELLGDELREAVARTNNASPVVALPLDCPPIAHRTKKRK